MAVAAVGAFALRLRTVPAVLIAQAAALLAMWALWEAVAWSGLVYKGVIPSSFDILASLAAMVRTAAFWNDCRVTAGEVLAATAIGSLCGIVTGIAVGGSRWLAAATEPYLHYLAATPKVVFLPMILVLAGVGPGSKVVMGTLSCFFPMALSIAVAVRQIDPTLLRLSRSLRLTAWQRTRTITLPALIAPILTGLRLALGMATVGCLVSELKLSNSGLGFEAIQAYNHFEVPAMYAAILVIFVLVMAGNAGFAALSRQCSPVRIRR